MAKFNLTKFNTLISIFLLFILSFMSLSFADSNGLWTMPENIQPGVFGGDEHNVNYGNSKPGRNDDNDLEGGGLTPYVFNNPVIFNRNIDFSRNMTLGGTNIENVFQSSISGNCPVGSVIQTINSDGSTICVNATQISNIDNIVNNILVTNNLIDPVTGLPTATGSGNLEWIRDSSFGNIGIHSNLSNIGIGRLSSSLYNLAVSGNSAFKGNSGQVAVLADSLGTTGAAAKMIYFDTSTNSEVQTLIASPGGYSVRGNGKVSGSQLCFGGTNCRDTWMEHKTKTAIFELSCPTNSGFKAFDTGFNLPKYATGISVKTNKYRSLAILGNLDPTDPFVGIRVIGTSGVNCRLFDQTKIGNYNCATGGAFQTDNPNTREIQNFATSRMFLRYIADCSSRGDKLVEVRFDYMVPSNGPKFPLEGLEPNLPSAISGGIVR